MYESDHHALDPAASVRLRIGGRSFGWELGPLAARIAGYFFGGIVLALVALPKTVRPAKASILVLPLVVAYYTMMHGVLFFGEPRYHAPLAPVLSILAAVGLAHAPLGKRLAGASRLQSDAT
jgi:hypothetical protein